MPRSLAALNQVFTSTAIMIQSSLLSVEMGPAARAARGMGWLPLRVRQILNTWKRRAARAGYIQRIPPAEVMSQLAIMGNGRYHSFSGNSIGRPPGLASFRGVVCEYNPSRVISLPRTFCQWKLPPTPSCVIWTSPDGKISLDPPMVLSFGFKSCT